MLVLTRKIGETIRATIAGESVLIKVLRVQGDRVKLGITAPPDIGIARAELRFPPTAGRDRVAGHSGFASFDVAPSGSG